MAPYDVNLVCWRVVHYKRVLLDAILKNPAEAIRDCGLSEAERVALLGGDVKTLDELGVERVAWPISPVGASAGSTQGATARAYVVLDRVITKLCSKEREEKWL